MSDFIIRDIVKKDIKRVLELMRELAVFEGYIYSFAVTEEVLETFCLEKAQFNVLVAEKNKDVEGILVYYFQPFTYDLSPWLIIKELYVPKKSRRSGIGDALFDAAYKRAGEVGSKRMKWEVLKSNTGARKFYLRKGAAFEDEWTTMSILVSG
ncbi:GNAT family N-acetyltransferase [Alteromonas sp. CYL-A6]|uniref:GNAT family N-acetyltransferase n=1 Tax=Alteromonas nitratireducens TaxID=3390813 RepID=UPI0034B05D70